MITTDAAREIVRAANEADRQVQVTLADGGTVTGTARWFFPSEAYPWPLLLFRAGNTGMTPFAVHNVADLTQTDEPADLQLGRNQLGQPAPGWLYGKGTE